jgi:hypothetical protein
MSALPNRRPSRPDPPGQVWSRCQARYGDDDFDLAPPLADYHHPTNAGMIGFIVSLVSLGLLIVVAILWVFLDQENRQQQNIERTRWMLYWFMFLDVVSFLAALTATIMGGRGLTPTNPLYRGFSVTALILGILEMLATAFFGLFLFCCVMVFEVFKAGG